MNIQVIVQNATVDYSHPALQTSYIFLLIIKCILLKYRKIYIGKYKFSIILPLKDSIAKHPGSFFISFHYFLLHMQILCISLYHFTVCLFAYQHPENIILYHWLMYILKHVHRSLFWNCIVKNLQTIQYFFASLFFMGKHLYFYFIWHRGEAAVSKRISNFSELKN